MENRIPQLNTRAADISFIIDKLQTMKNYNIYNYGDGFFSLDTIEAHLIKQLKNKEYDYVILPVANNHIEGYRNVLDVARLIEAKVILGIYPEGNVFVIEEKKEAAVALG